MLAKRNDTKKTTTKDEYAGIVPERLLVTNETVILITLLKEDRWLTAFEIGIGAATLKGDPSRSVQLQGGLKQLEKDGLIQNEKFADGTSKRQVYKYLLTDKGKRVAELYKQLFLEFKS